MVRIYYIFFNLFSLPIFLLCFYFYRVSNKLNQSDIRTSLLKYIAKLDIFSLMCAADKVWITELTLIHINIRSVRNSHVQELALILKIIGQCMSNTSDNVCLNLQNCRYSISIYLQYGYTIKKISEYLNLHIMLE